MTRKEMDAEAMKEYKREAERLGVPLLEYLLFIIAERLEEIGSASGNY